MSCFHLLTQDLTRRKPCSLHIAQHPPGSAGHWCPSRGANERKGGIPSWWPMSVSTKFRGLEMDAPSDIPYRYASGLNHTLPWKNSPSTWLSWLETPTLPRWITGTTRLPPARTETAHAFSGHRSLGRWQRPTTDPYHHMINVNVNVNTILISIQSMSIPPQMSFLV